MLHDGELGGEPPPQPEWTEHLLMEKTGRPLHEIRAWSLYDWNIALMRIQVENIMSRQTAADQRQEQALAEWRARKTQKPH